MTENDALIVLQFDSRYYPWGSLNFQSLAWHETQRRVVADTIKLTAEQIAELRNAHPRVEVRAATRRLPTPEESLEMDRFR